MEVRSFCKTLQLKSLKQTNKQTKNPFPPGVLAFLLWLCFSLPGWGMGQPLLPSSGLALQQPFLRSGHRWTCMLLWREGIRWTLSVSVYMRHTRMWVWDGHTKRAWGKQPACRCSEQDISPGLRHQQCDSPSQHVLYFIKLSHTYPSTLVKMWHMASKQDRN